MPQQFDGIEERPETIRRALELGWGVQRIKSHFHVGQATIAAIKQDMGIVGRKNQGVAGIVGSGIPKKSIPTPRTQVIESEPVPIGTPICEGFVLVRMTKGTFNTLIRLKWLQRRLTEV